MEETKECSHCKGTGRVPIPKSWDERLKEWRELNLKHKENPQVGDYWQDHLVGICVVAKVTEDQVYLHTKKIIDNDGWMWDFNDTTIVARKEFIEMHKYGGIEGYWCDVEPMRHKGLFEIEDNSHMIVD